MEAVSVPFRRVGVVTSRFNEQVTNLLREGALSYLDSVEGIEIFSISVPGAVEIPLAVQGLIEAGCEGVVALGAVIKGDTAHFDYVCQSVTQGLTRLALDFHCPIGFGVLTTDTEEQALDRAGGEHGNKGAEAAQVVVEMMGLLEELIMIDADEELMDEDELLDFSDFDDYEDSYLEALPAPKTAKKGKKASPKVAAKATKKSSKAKTSAKTSKKSSKKSRK